MVFTKSCRLALDELDGKWVYKFLLHVVLNVFCWLSIATCVFVLSQKSSFQSENWKEDDEIVIYLPYAIVTIVWNIVNITYLSKRKKHISPLINIVVHFILAAAAFILGSMATVVVSTSISELIRNIYGDSSQGNHWVLSASGYYVLVTPENIASCPAFPNCESQRLWIQKAQIRYILALVGCGLVDVSFFLHLALVIWSSLDLFHGTRPKWPPPAPPLSPNREPRISNPTLLSAPWPSKPASQTSLPLLHAHSASTPAPTPRSARSARSTTSLSDIEAELAREPCWYPGRLPQGGAIADDPQPADPCWIPAAAARPSVLPEIEMPPLRQPLFAGGSEQPLGPLGGLAMGGERAGADSRRNGGSRKYPAKVVAGSLPGHRRGGTRMIGAAVGVPKGSLNDRGLLGRTY